jgi:hypothetical protein
MQIETVLTGSVLGKNLRMVYIGIAGQSEKDQFVSELLFGRRLHFRMHANFNQITKVSACPCPSLGVIPRFVLVARISIQRGAGSVTCGTQRGILGGFGELGFDGAVESPKFTSHSGMCFFTGKVGSSVFVLPACSENDGFFFAGMLGSRTFNGLYSGESHTFTGLPAETWSSFEDNTSASGALLLRRGER